MRIPGSAGLTVGSLAQSMSTASTTPSIGASDASSRTTQPIVTGTSVIAIKYKDGVIMAADTLGSYGSLARFTDLRRIKTVGNSTLVGASGEYSDFQYISDLLDSLETEDFCADDGRSLHAGEVLSYLTRVMYNRRNKFNPLWNALVVAGFDGERVRLGTVDKIGTTFEDDYIATGFGHHLAMPIIREAWKEDMSEEEARALVEQCMRVLYYRDCRTINKITLAKITRDSALVSEPYTLDTKWDFEAFVRAKAGADTGGSW